MVPPITDWFSQVLTRVPYMLQNICEAPKRCWEFLSFLECICKNLVQFNLFSDSSGVYRPASGGPVPFWGCYWSSPGVSQSTVGTSTVRGQLQL